jgi:inner membrane protein involved in colicin E2 resistance
MKNLITCICLIVFAFVTQAQQPTKYQKGRATLFSTYIADKMDLNDNQEKMVYNVMLERVVNANAKIRANKDMSKEEKQAIYKAEFSNAQKKLAAEFGQKQAREMMLLSNEARKNADNK